jgi:hypothetical protein
MNVKPKHKRSGDEGIGLYTAEQEKNTTLFAYFAQIVIGGVVLVSGVAYLAVVLGVRHKEALQFGSPETHLYGFAVALAIIAVGIFFAHAGVIFWARRLRTRLTKRPPQR